MMASGRRESIGEILIDEKRINADQLQKALVRQDGGGRLLGEVMVELGYVNPEDVAAALAKQLNIPFFRPDDNFRLEREEVHLIPEGVARKYCLFPTRRPPGGDLLVVMSDPINIDAIDTIRTLTDLTVHKAVSTPAWILKVIDKFYSEEAYLERNFEDIVDRELGDTATKVAAAEDANDDQLRILANDAPVVRLVNLLLMEAIRDGASDIHIEPSEKKLTVRLRIDGRLREVKPPPHALHRAIITRIKILADMDIAERRLPLDGRFKFTFMERIIDIRASSLPEVYGEKMVLRVLDRASLLVDMADIGIDPYHLERFQTILGHPNGIILLTGPTGSGKTSTLYSALSYLKSPECNIQTVEDPVEYQLDGINQMQIRPKIGLDFANALRSILRQDPDIVMIGEIRDLETARIAMQASLTGHLVLSTLHTNDAPSTFSRLKDIGVDAYLIAATVNLVISQRLVRLLCPKCKAPTIPTGDQLKLLASDCPDADTWTFLKPTGCPDCSNFGFKGRTAILEFLEVTDSLREMILGGSGTHEIRNQAIETGMQPLFLNGLSKVKQGVTTLGEILAVCAVDSRTDTICEGAD